MELKKVVTYKIPFHSKGVMWCGILLGLAVFVRYIYYLGPCDFTAWNAGIWIFKIILPTLLCGAYAVLIKLVHLRSPGLYGILSAALCVTLLVCDIMDRNILLIILSMLTLPLLGFLLLATFGGYIPYRSISSFALLLVCVLRLFFWTVSAVAFGAIIPDLLILLGLFCFTISLNPCED